MKLKFDLYQFNKAQSHGIPVHWKNIPWANGFAHIRIVIGVGARHDPVGKEGLDHFIEHILFDGCLRWPTQDAIEETGRTLFMNTLNACTGSEKTVIEGKINVRKLASAMRFLRNVVYSPIIDPTEVERERGVITREIWQRYDNRRCEDLAKLRNKLIFGDHTFSRQARAFGWHDTVETITRSDLTAFHREHYHGSNTSIVIVGDIDESTLADLDAFTAEVPKGIAMPRTKKVDSWPSPKQNEFVISASEYYGLTDASIPETASIEVHRNMPIQDNAQVVSITRDLVWQILFTRIRRNLGITYSPSVTGNVYSDHAEAKIVLSVDPRAVNKVRDIISSTISEIASGHEEHRETFDDTKEVYLEKKLFLDPTAEDIAENAVDELVATGRIYSTEKDYSEAEKVTYESVSLLFARELRPEQLFWGILTP